MAISNRERVGRALDKLRDGLYPFIEREMKAAYGEHWLRQATTCLPDHYLARKQGKEVIQEDVSALLIVMWEHWNNIFKNILGRTERSMVSELRDTRNDWAHTSTFSTDNTYRALDSVARLLAAVSAPEADIIEKEKQELLRIRFEDQARRETKRVAIAPTEGKPLEGLKPWREISTPHPDVASGNYQQAEFAADLWQVYLDEGSDEYRLPDEFFARTYLTEGLKQLLIGAILRLSGKGGNPVIELQTNFGGGKTHALLSLYHLFSGVEIQDLPGLETLFQESGINKLPTAVNTVVIVGNKIPPGEARVQKCGIKIHTLWGEIAWQLGGKEGYEMVREADETSTNPGDKLKLLFNRYAPCLILIDEWVAYARQLHDKNDLPGGSFDTHFTFAQTLSESAKNADRTLLVVSVPSSDIEKGGDRGQESVNRLKNAIGRVESPWRPASAEESFEIVRRRLFQTTTDTNLFVARDAVVKAFAEMYRNQVQEFPSECRETNYERRLRDAYPIHPELFDRLYSDWSSLDKFQRTRGVLRLMAKVIHSLWERGDRSLMIMPAQIPMDDNQVQSELTHYLDDHWIPVIEKDVDGPNSLPLSIDRENHNFGRYSACRRVTRTIYIGSAPTVRAGNRGIEDRRIKLGCVQPGEVAATFGDALRYITDQATYLYIDGNRYWISTQPNVTRIASERAEQIKSEGYPIWEEIIKRLKSDRSRGELSGIHLAPESSADIPDDPNLGVRMVILGPQHPHTKLSEQSPARQFLDDILNHKGTGPRYHKNTLVFLVPDKSQLDNLSKYVAQYLAWDSILNEKEELNLDAFQTKQAQTKGKESDNDVNNLLQITYQWLLIPSEPKTKGVFEWQEIRLQGQDSPILQVSRRLLYEEQLITAYSGIRLCQEALEKYLWRDLNHINLKQLWEYLTTYLYLPRLKNANVLLEAIKEGVASTDWMQKFAYAEAWDEKKQRYLGLKAGMLIQPVLDGDNLIVKPEVALQQLNRDQPVKASQDVNTETTNSLSNHQTSANGSHIATAATTRKAPVFKRFYGSVELETLRINRDVPKIAQAVIQHLITLNDAEVKITLEIEANIPEGVPDSIVRAVTENCQTLKFTTQGFEED